jgi:hypothetical protein
MRENGRATFERSLLDRDKAVVWEEQRITRGVKESLSSREDAAWNRSEWLDLRIGMLSDV